VSSPQKAALGVLFVHGIGAQRRGETLATFGGALYQWLERACERTHRRWVGAGITRESVKSWADTTVRPRHEARRDFVVADLVARLLEATPRADDAPVVDVRSVAGAAQAEFVATSVALDEVRLTSVDVPDRPSNATLSFHGLQADGALSGEAWLLAESWWAETFSVPSFGDLAGWGLGIIPWTLGSHFGERVRLAWAAHRQAKTAAERAWSFVKLIRAFLALVASLLLSVVTMAWLLLLLVLAAIPITSLREALGAMQRRFAAYLGDSYVLVTRPIEGASIVGQVRRDLEWMSERCDAVAVVAHSQGAAVAYEALRAERPANLRLFLTFGAGLRKLEELRKIVREGRRFRMAATKTLLGLALVQLLPVLAARWYFGSRAPEPMELAILGIEGLAGGALLVAGLYDLVRGTGTGAVRDVADQLATWGVRWVDCHASHDPVPNGALFDSTSTAAALVAEAPVVPAPPISIEVCNQRSTRRDHNAYWANVDEFVSVVVGALRHAGGTAAAPLSLDADWLRVIPRRRRWRVAHLTLLRWVAAVAIVAGLLRYPTEWLTVSGWALRQLARWLGRFVGVGESSLPASAAAPGWTVLWYSAGLLAVTAAIYGIAHFFWRRWDEADSSSVLEQTGDQEGEYPLIAATAALIAAAAFAIVAKNEAVAVAFVGGLLLVTIVSAILEPRVPGQRRRRVQVPKEEPLAIEQATAVLQQWLSAGAMMLGFGLMITAVAKWLRPALPMFLSPWAVGALFIGAGALLYARRVIKSRNQRFRL
jgi:hypothetical protein